MDLIKIVGPILRDAVDFGEYRFTIIIERKIDDKQGLVIEKLEFEKKMSALEADLIKKNIKKLTDQIEKKWNKRKKI